MAVKRLGKTKQAPSFVRAKGVERVPQDGRSPAGLLEDLVQGRLDARDLTKEQRQAVLLLQVGGKHTTAELAELLSVTPKRIRKDMAEIRRQVGREVTNWTIEEVVGGMILKAERYQARAAAQEDVALAWAIERDKVKMLKELGLVGAPQRDGIRLTLEVLGQGYERARLAMGQGLDPRLTGQVVEEQEQDEFAQPVLETRGRVLPQLGLPTTLPVDESTGAPST